MKRFRQGLVSTLALLLLLSLTSAVAFAQDPANGKVLWEEQTSCQRCHGINGEGVFGAPLAGTTATVEEFITQVRSPRNRMPSYSTDQASDAMITDIHAYLASLPEPAEFGFKQIELAADAPEGQTLIVEKRCVACHGDTGPINGFIKRGETPTAERVITQLRTPFKSMPSFNADQVSDAEAALIADFMAVQVAAAGPPADLPASGGDNTSTAPLYLLVAGLTLLAAGFAVRKVVTRIG